MKVIVCGAGQVGSNIAKYLAGGDNEVTVIDQQPELVRRLGDTLDVRTLVGHASHPDVLEEAGAADAEMIVAVTYADEVNMVACMIAHSLFNVPTKIARIRAQTYLRKEWSNLFTPEHMPIDAIISPEIEVARAIGRRLQIPGAFDMIPLADDKVKVVGVHCLADCPVVNTPLRQLTSLFPDLDITVLAIVRKDRSIIPDSDEQMLPGDDAYFAAASDHLPRALVAFGHEEKQARRVVIIGGGNIGLYLAQEIERDSPHVSAKLIEIDAKRAERVAGALSRTVVLNGSALDDDILVEANMAETETVVTVTNDDETNILSALLAKRHGARRAVTLVNRPTYGPLIGSLGIDAVVSPSAVTVSSILQHVRRGRIRNVHALGNGFAEVIEAEALETSGLTGKPLREVQLPDGVLVGAVVRQKEVIIPRPDTTIRSGDRVVLLAMAEAVKKVEKMFTVRLEFF